MRDANMYDVVRVSKERLIGEIIEMHGDEASHRAWAPASPSSPWRFPFRLTSDPA